MRRDLRTAVYALQACLGLLAILASTSVCPAQDVPFLRGDANADGRLSISDALMIRRHLFTGGTVPTCMKAADVDDWYGGVIPGNNQVDLTDVIYLIQAMFLDGPTIPAPFPEIGLDPTEDNLPCDSYDPIPPGDRRPRPGRRGRGFSVTGGPDPDLHHELGARRGLPALHDLRSGGPLLHRRLG